MTATPVALVVARAMLSPQANFGASAIGGGGGGVGAVGDLLQPLASSAATIRTMAERAATDFDKPIDMNQAFYRNPQRLVSPVQIRNILA